MKEDIDGRFTGGREAARRVLQNLGAAHGNRAAAEPGAFWRDVLKIGAYGSLAAFIAACGGTTTSGNSTSLTGTLNVIHNYGPSDTTKGPTMQAFLSGFEKLYPKVTVSAQVSTDTAIPTQVETAFLAGQEPGRGVSECEPRGTELGKQGRCSRS